MLNNKITQTSSKSRAALLCAIVVIASIAVYNWTVSPQTAYLHAARQYQQVAKDAKQRTLILEKTIGRKQQELSVAQADYEDLRVKFFSTLEANKFMADVEPLATDLGCVVDSLRFMPLDEIEDNAGVSAVKITSRRASIRLTGRYDSIAGLIRELSENIKTVVISDLGLEVTPDFSALTCDMNITIYILEDREINNDVKS